MCHLKFGINLPVFENSEQQVELGYGEIYTLKEINFIGGMGNYVAIYPA